MTDEKWWLQEVAEAQKVISTDIPAWIEIVVHRAVTEQRYPSPFWSVSDRKTGAGLEVAVGTDRDTVVAAAIEHLQTKTEEKYDAKVQECLDLRTLRRRVRKKRLKKR